jgi:hypothetical protein
MKRESKKKRPRISTEKFVDAASLLGVKKVNQLRIVGGEDRNVNGFPNLDHIKAYNSNRRLQKKIEERKQLALQFANVTPEMVLGATAMRAFATIDEAFDDNGNFDMKLARASGAIHLVKKLEMTQFGLKAEFYSNETAQMQLANYMGMEFQPRENNDAPSLKAAVEAAAKAIAQEMGVEVTHEIRVQAWDKCLQWIRESKAKYSEAAITEVDRLLRARTNGFGVHHERRQLNGHDTGLSSMDRIEPGDPDLGNGSNGHKTDA